MNWAKIEVNGVTEFVNRNAIERISVDPGNEKLDVFFTGDVNQYSFDKRHLSELLGEVEE